MTEDYPVEREESVRVLTVSLPSVPTMQRMTLFTRIVATALAATSPAAAQAKPLKLDNGNIVIPRKNIGSVDLTKLTIGDKAYSTTSPSRGNVYMCDVPPGMPQNYDQDLAWVHGDTWNLKQKTHVQGKIKWSQASFSNTIQGPTRLLSGNSLPVGHTTGVFPAQGTGPDGIEASSYDLSVQSNPTVNASPHCMGMEVGVTLDGVALYNGFDANMYDAGVHELQDDCQGHPNRAGYHRHIPPLCFKDPGKGQSRLMGYALDGFGIYGHRGPDGKVMTNADLDVCHGITSKVKFNGKWVRMYHYVETWEFPYTVGCFRGTPNLQRFG
jgi:hypothetical protein